MFFPPMRYSVHNKKSHLPQILPQQQYKILKHKKMKISFSNDNKTTLIIVSWYNINYYENYYIVTYICRLLTFELKTTLALRYITT